MTEVTCAAARGAIGEFGSWAMGKSKGKGQKQKNVFHVANKNITKAKSKAKPVTTSLKKINIVNDEKVTMVNKIFTQVQKEVKQLSKAASSDPPKRHLIQESPEREPPNVDAATNLLSHL
ncbi:ribosomal biogenesis factor [Heteronotia binoei]|uniref:ribosomal biogenesis factor n=1 Tax=Heteronotia binoei TaxID=13085 RepID=UPI00292CD14B|nr:ribosomal biogenesis factor [Heteronotia binoei]